MLGHPDEGYDVIANAIELADGKISDDELIQLKFNLAYATRDQGKHVEAANMLDEIIDRGLASTTIPDREKLDAILTLAESRFLANQFPMARSEFHRMLELIPRLKVNEAFANRNRAAANFRLASMAFWEDSNSKSLDAMLDAYHGFVKHHPPDHRNVIAVAYTMTGALRSKKRYDEALEIAEKCFEMATIKYGPGDFATLMATDGLLVVCGENSVNSSFRNRMVEVLPIAEKNCHALIANVGLKHPNAIVYYGNVASAYGLIGNLDKCVEIKRELVAIAEKNLGRNSPVTQSQVYGLAIALKTMEYHEEAIELLTEFIAAADSGVELPKANVSQAQRELWLSTIITTVQGPVPEDNR